MKKLLLIALTGLLTIGASAPVMALGPLDVDAELPFYSKYVWRGTNRVNDSVMQPSLDVGLFGFTLGVWGNYDLTDINGKSGKFTEVDYTLGYELTLPLVNLGGGFISYDFPEHDIPGTTEFYLSGGVNVLLSPKLEVFFDIDEIKGTYWLATIDHDFGLGETSKINLASGLGMGSESYVAGYFGNQMTIPNNDLGASATDFYLTVSVPFHPIPFLSIIPSATYTSLLGDAKKALDEDNALYSNKKTNFYWGLSGVFSF